MTLIRIAGTRGRVVGIVRASRRGKFCWASHPCAYGRSRQITSRGATLA